MIKFNGAKRLNRKGVVQKKIKPAATYINV